MIAEPLDNPSSDSEAMRDNLMRRANELYHDLQAAEFDRVHRHRHRVERLFWTRQVVPRLREAGASFGIDLCTGTGFVPSVLLPQLKPDARLLCVDVSPGALDEARRRLGSLATRVDFHPGDARDIPADDASADWVSLNAGLHHVPEPQRALMEIDRVLKVGGRFCLGHEPNAAFFGSPALHRCERLIWSAFWYLSPARNLQRIRRRLGARVDDYESHEHLDIVNETLLREKLIEAPLTIAELRDLVDVHTDSEDEHENVAGFLPEKLIEQHFGTYEVEALLFADYGGEMLRRHLWLRGGFDGLMRALYPRKGRLFSWVLRKREAKGQCSA
jgi:SAM-dependent methyltransferase